MAQTSNLTGFRTPSAAAARIVLVAWLAVALLCEAPPTAAHGVLAGYVQHAIQLRVDAKHVDLFIDVTFFEGPSASERALMDDNRDGRITRSEVDNYLKRRAVQLLQQVKLWVSGRELPLAPLYAPEIELPTDRSAALAHHRLRLAFFAVTPAGLKVGDEILVEDQLWAGVKSLGAPQAEGGDGCQILPEFQVCLGAGREASEPVRQFRFRCVKPPVRKATSATSASADASRR